MLPSREEAENLLMEAERCNPGPWGNHSRVVAHCAEKIAEKCPDMDADKAYIVGLLHDIGRKFGARHLGHVSDGYRYMLSLGYDEVAKICLTHSFDSKTTDNYIGNFDTTQEELQLIQEKLQEATYDDYDKLIQLCDAIGGAEGVMNIEERMGDVKRRYGSYPLEKWNANLDLKQYFEDKIGEEIYSVVEKDIFHL
nr:HD domain-containing protein [uncultured Sellimonas sp.]